MSRRRPHRDPDLAVTHEITVPPFVDVSLLRLIIFMVAAPRATTHVPVSLPGSNAEPQPKPDKPVVVTLQADLDLSLGDKRVTPDALAAALDQASGHNRQTV